MPVIRQPLIYLGLLVSVFLAACGGQAAPEAAAPPTVTTAPTPSLAVASTVADTPTAAAPPAPAEQPTDTPEAVDWLTVEGKTEDGYTYRGNPDAPVTILDYSDFL